MARSSKGNFIVVDEELVDIGARKPVVKTAHIWSSGVILRWVPVVGRWCTMLAMVDGDTQCLKEKVMLTESLKLRKAAVGTTTLP